MNEFIIDFEFDTIRVRDLDIGSKFTTPCHIEENMNNAWIFIKTDKINSDHNIICTDINTGKDTVYIPDYNVINLGNSSKCKISIRK